MTTSKQSQPEFPTDYKTILARLRKIKPLKYAGTRNFVDGDVTYLSPYISRGVISLKQVMDQALKKNDFKKIYKFIQELAWREYWQRIWQAKGDAIFDDLKHQQDEVKHHAMITAIEKAATGIDAIDKHIQLLYDSGYMHNHVRMYVASITCNIGQAHWWKPSQWLYYHLLDGDLASNSLSWQWVAGAFSSKKYFCNQENIDRYTHSEQADTFLDAGYDVITKMAVPKILSTHKNSRLTTKLPATKNPVFKNKRPILVYNSYNLDPKWHARKNMNRVLLLEPDHFKQFPVCEKVLQFFIDLSKNIKNIQVFVGSFDELKELAGNREIIYKLHPTTLHYEGTGENYEDMFPEVSGYFPSFSKYWKACLKLLGDRL